MKNIFKLFSVTLLLAVIATSCMEVDPWFESFDPATSDVPTTVILSEPNLTVSVNPTETTTTVIIGVSTWGSFLDQDLTLPFIVDAATMDASWYTIAGSGFTIPAGSNSGSLVMTIDNTVFPGGYFNLEYHLGEPSIAGVTISELAASGVVDAFSPGDLHPFMGDFNVYCDSYGDVFYGYADGSWDEEWDVTIVLNRTNSNQIDIYGVAGSSMKVTGTVDLTNNTISIAGGQNIGAVYGYGDLAPFLGDPTDFSYSSSAPIVGTVNATTGGIDIDNVMMWHTAEDWDWDMFHCVFTKATKKNLVELYVPASKIKAKAKN